jgi:hypothetical protein
MTTSPRPPPRERPGATHGKGITLHASIKRAAVAFGAAALCLGTVASAASASTHPHATRNTTVVCGNNCYNLSNEFLDNGQPGSYVQNAVQGGLGGFNMRRAGNARTNEDFTPNLTGFVFQYCDNVLNPFGIFSSSGYVCTHYLFAPVFQAEVSPDGTQNGGCIGVATAGVSERTSDQPCGRSLARTLWIGDWTQSVSPPAGTYLPWINGADAALSNPLVLTVNPNSHHPANVLRVNEELLTGGIVRDTQQFALEIGPTA